MTYDQLRRKVTAKEVLAAINVATSEESVDFSHCEVIGDLHIDGSGLPRTSLEDTPDNGLLYWTIEPTLRFKDTVFRGSVNLSRAVFRRTAYFDRARFLGNTSFQKASFQQWIAFTNIVYEGDANFVGTEFHGVAAFSSNEFRAKASYGWAIFHELTDFGEAQFRGKTDFTETTFHQRISFAKALFGRDVVLRGARFIVPGDFAEIQYENDSLVRAVGMSLLKVLAPLQKPAPRPKYKNASDHERKTIQFYLDSNAIDEVTNPFFKRYVSDQQFVREFTKTHPIWGGIWRWSSDYGRNIGVWAAWSLAIAFLFGILYAPYALPTMLRDTWIGSFLESVDPQLDITNSQYLSAQQITHIVPYYFSIVTFTTLGFGDVTPTNTAGMFWITLEVVLGYVMLGGLISILSNKLARRSGT